VWIDFNPELMLIGPEVLLLPHVADGDLPAHAQFIPENNDLCGGMEF